MRWLGTAVLVWALCFSCAHAPPEVAQVATQVNDAYDPALGHWTQRLAAFVQAVSRDGSKVFDRIHLIHDGQGYFFSLNKANWAEVERPGEFWVGAPGLSFPDGKVPTGEWRVLLVTRSGQKVSSSFQVAPPALGESVASRAAVTLRPVAGFPGRFTVSNWAEDYLVWVRDAKGTVLSTLKIVGPTFQVPQGMDSLTLYSYDKARGVGLEAGPFSLKDVSKPADR